MADADPRRYASAADDLMSRPFDVADITDLRHAVATCAGSVGLAGNRLDDFVLVINELITNAVRHGGGAGRLRLWSMNGVVVCEVSDQGPGMRDQVIDGRTRPSPERAGGWGLWLARRLSDDMTVDTGPAGTTVRVSAATSITPPGANPRR